MKLKEKLKTMVDIILIILLVILSIKKGGFYKTDCLTFNLVIVFIGIIYIITYYLNNIFINYIKKKNCEESLEKKSKNAYIYKFDIIEILLLLLSISYILPIIFNNYSNLSDSIYEMIRYFNIYIIYFIVKKSDNKKVYVFSILFISLILCLLGIDGLANRYLQNVLSSISSGYLTTSNLSRMSSTIQYANVFSLICILACVLLINYLKNIKLEKVYNRWWAIKYSLVLLLIFIYSSSIILSQSRIILILLAIYTIYILLSKSSNNKIYIFITLLFSLIYSNIFMNILQIDKTYTYIFTVISYLIVYFVSYMLFKYLNLYLNIIFIKFKLKSIVRKIKENIVLKVICLFGIFILYIILAFYIKVPIKLNSEANNNVISRNIYKLDEGVENEILVKINPKIEDTRYNVKFLLVNDKLETKEIKSFGYYSNTNDTFKIDYIQENDFKYLIVNIICEKGKLEVTDILVNNKQNYIDYFLFPSEIMYRIEDLANGDTSFIQRLYYTKDAIKIITNSIKNFIIGIGGEGFKNSYELVKSNNYSSTEIHNVYLQIFVESGLIGFVIFLAILILSLKKSKYNISKLLLIIIYITSLLDLNFSYMLIMCIFAILLGLLEENENNKNRGKIEKINNKIMEYLKFVIYNLYYILSILLFTLIFVILLKSNIAYYMKVPKLAQDNISFNEILESIQIKKKRVQLDRSENAYIVSLLEDYEKYLELIRLNLDEKSLENINDIQLLEYDNVLLEVEGFLEKIKNNEKYNNDLVTKYCNIFQKYVI